MARRKEKQTERPLLDRIESRGRRMRALIRSMDAGRLGVSPRQLAALRQYLELLALECSDGNAGQPSVRTIGDRLGWSRRKTQLVRLQAVELGLVRIEFQTCEYTGRERASLQTIDWSKIQQAAPHAAGQTEREREAIGEPSPTGFESVSHNMAAVAMADSVGSENDLSFPVFAQGGARVAQGGARVAPLRRNTTGKVFIENLPPIPPENDWQSIGDRLASLGVGDWLRLVQEVRQRVPLEHAAAIVDWYEANAASLGYGSGALALRFRRANTALAIDAGWPPPTVAPAKPRPAKPTTENDIRFAARRRLIDQGITGDALVEQVEQIAQRWKETQAC